MGDLKMKIRDLIEQETIRGHFQILDTDRSVNLIEQIINNYEKTNCIKRNDGMLPKSAELIFVAAPTGAGKDTLVARLNYKNPEKKYIELNMDIFRYYFPYFIENLDELTDKNFANLTNEFAYEIFFTVQLILLQEFPGTNIIITGTLRETDWVEETFKRFKEDTNTNYTVKLACLTVPKKVSAMSIIKRYIGIVNSQKDWLKAFPGTARFTSMKYHDETFERFPKNLQYFEEIFEKNPGQLIDVIEVYKRGKDMLDLDEETMVYSSSDLTDKRSAFDAVIQVRSSGYKFENEEIFDLFDKIKNNREYLKSQGTLIEVLRDFATIFNYTALLDRINGEVSDLEELSEIIKN